MDLLSYSAGGKLALGAGLVGAVFAAAETVSPEIVAKATPTPWEAIIMASITVGVGILHRYTAPEKKLDAHHAMMVEKHSMVVEKIDKLVLDSANREQSDLLWKMSTSEKLGAISQAQVDLSRRVQVIESK